MCEESWIPEDRYRDVLYQVVAQRRVNCDTKMWQAPVLGLTAQAFLFTIVCGAHSPAAARVISGLLAFVAAVASIMLMSRHRRFEVADSKWLQAYEETHFHMTPPPTSQSAKPLPRTAPHAAPRPFFEEAGGLDRFGLYKIWLCVLGLFGVVAPVTAIIWACYTCCWFEAQ